METNENKIKPSVEKFLNLIKKSRRGTLKIYIGMAAGVGKTFRMLQEAHQLQKNNIDVIIGYVETHGRAETEKLLEGIPVIERKRIFYRGNEFEEFDIEAVLRRRPEVVIVDELAHTNIPGSRNEKRYKDIEELVNNGINVISAVNIQHIESLNSVIEDITGIKIRERVPDYIFEFADEVVNIDIPVAELINRLEQGKIYKEDKIQTSLNNFFKKENLLHLRELALREVANTVEKKIDLEISREEKVSEKILVCIGTNIKLNEKIIRKSGRMADRIDASWYVIFADNPKDSFADIKLDVQRHIINNFKLATELGAFTEKIKSDNPARAIFEYAKEKDITHIVVGRHRKSNILKNFFSKNLIEELLDLIEDEDIDLEIIN